MAVAHLRTRRSRVFFSPKRLRAGVLDVPTDGRHPGRTVVVTSNRSDSGGRDHKRLRAGVLDVPTDGRHPGRTVVVTSNRSDSGGRDHRSSASAMAAARGWPSRRRISPRSPRRRGSTASWGPTWRRGCSAPRSRERGSGPARCRPVAPPPLLHGRPSPSDASARRSSPLRDGHVHGWPECSRGVRGRSTRRPGVAYMHPSVDGFPPSETFA